jgi:hypothetical protein
MKGKRSETAKNEVKKRNFTSFLEEEIGLYWLVGVMF